MKMLATHLFFAPLLWCVAQADVSRMLAATGLDSVGDLADTIPTSPVYQKVSSSFGSPQLVNPSSGWLPAQIYATLELSTNASYAYNYKDGNGTTRYNVTVLLVKTGGFSGSSTPPAISAHLHSVECGGPDFSNSHVMGANGKVVESLSFTTSNFTAETSGRNATNSTILDFLVDYDEASSVAIHGNDAIMGCVNLRPPFPDFPDDWSATIENTDSTNGTTFVMSQIYSHTLNKIRLDVHSFGSDRIIVTDPGQTLTTLISPANGSCSSPRRGRFTNWITESDNITLLSTAELLHFTDDEDFEYIPGTFDVRGIECELWQRTVEIDEDWAQASFEAHFYFPVNQWLVGREDYHRMLKRVYTNGTWDGEPFEMYQEFVNFRPRQVYPAMFDICAISPYGSNCNCTDALRKSAYQNITQALSADDGVTVSNSVEDACDLAAPIPHGFVKQQAGPYVGLVILGLFAGSLFTGVGMYLFYRKRVGVTITDNLGHTKFQDSPGM